MNWKTRVLAVLDQQFYLHTPVWVSGREAMYLATHRSGTEVRIKLIARPELFFYQLAHLYTRDDSCYFPLCLYHYPPASVSGTRLPLDCSPPALFETSSGAAPGGSRDIGVLVLEDVRGVSLMERFPALGGMEQIDILIELTLALQILRDRKLSPGPLRQAHIIIAGEELKILDSPCLPFENEVPGDLLSGPGAIGFFQKFCDHAMKSTRRLRKWLDRLNQSAPEGLTLEAIREALKKRRQRFQPFNGVDVLFSFLKPAHLAAWLVLIWVMVSGIGYLQGEGASLARKRNRVLAQTDHAVEDRIQALRQLRREGAAPPFDEVLVRDIAELTRTRPVKIMQAADLSRPIAVLAFQHREAVIGREHIFRPGDWVRAGSRFGFLTAIEFNRIKLEFEGAYSWHYFERPYFSLGKAVGNQVALVWDNPGNLPRLMEALADMLSLTFVNENTSTPTAAEIQTGYAGRISGLFVAHSPQTLLPALRDFVAFRCEPPYLVMNRFTDPIPVFKKIKRIHFEGVGMAPLGEWLAQVLGHEVRIDPALSARTIHLNLFNTTWQEVLRELRLEGSLTKVGENSVFLLRESAPITPNP